jgi:hypothetical protein
LPLKRQRFGLNSARFDLPDPIRVFSHYCAIIVQKIHVPLLCKKSMCIKIRVQKIHVQKIRVHKKNPCAKPLSITKLRGVQIRVRGCHLPEDWRRNLSDLLEQSAFYPLLSPPTDSGGLPW